MSRDSRGYDGGRRDSRGSYGGGDYRDRGANDDKVKEDKIYDPLNDGLSSQRKQEKKKTEIVIPALSADDNNEDDEEKESGPAKKRRTEDTDTDAAELH